MGLRSPLATVVRGSKLVFHGGMYTAAGRKERNPSWRNQDACFCQHVGRSRLLLGVLDGHGSQGTKIAQGVKDLISQLGPSLFGEDLETAQVSLPEVLSRLFAVVHDGLAKGGLAELSGTTATLAVLDADKGTLACAHVGDSGLLVTDSGQVTFQTEDHEVTEEDEERLAELGGEVRQLSVSGVTAMRVFLQGQDYPGLAMSRSLGDLQAHRVGVLAEPSVAANVQLPSRGAVIIASDGIWHKCSRAEAASKATTAASRQPGNMATELVTDAQEHWAREGQDMDDATAVVVYLSPAAA